MPLLSVPFHLISQIIAFLSGERDEDDRKKGELCILEGFFQVCPGSGFSFRDIQEVGFR